MLFSTKIFPGYIKFIKVKTPITLKQVSFETNEEGEGQMDVYIETKSTTCCSLLCKLSKKTQIFSFELSLGENDEVKVQGNGDGVCRLYGHYINHEDLQTAIISSTKAVAGQLMKALDRTIVKLRNGCIYCDFEEGKGRRAEPKSEVFLQIRGIVPGQAEPFVKFGAHLFSFILGSGELIPGLDESILGMKEGGYRNITVPSSQAFGAVGIPRLGIPPNADIQYEVILVKVLIPAGRFSKGYLFQ